MAELTTEYPRAADPLERADWSTPPGAGGLRAELRAGGMVFRREVLHFLRSRVQAFVVLLQPIMFLFILGVGLSRLVSAVGGGADSYLRFVFPGVLVMAIEAPAVSAGASIVHDRQDGFMREMLVAPVRPGTLILGKCAGGAFVATIQGSVLLACAGVIGIPWHPDLVGLLAAEMALAALMFTTLSAMIAVSIKRTHVFNTIMAMTMSPMVFLSGVMFPITAMPAWVAKLSLVNPLTYAVDALRHTIASRLPHHGPSVMFQPVSWLGWTVPVLVELGVVAAFTLTALAYASHRLSRLE
jgi:ABC-2 type transport system permease protein